MVVTEKGHAVLNHRGRRIRDISPNMLNEMLRFIAGGVRIWCKENRHRQFALRDLFGGVNYDWTGTPLQGLYEKYIRNGCSETDAIARAGKDAGRLLKRVLVEDTTRTYVVGDAGKATGYTWK